MIADALSLLANGLVSVLLLVFGLLPTVDVSSLPLALPEQVTGALGALNYFIPISDLLTILVVWIGLVLTLNVVFIVYGLVSALSK